MVVERPPRRSGRVWRKTLPFRKVSKTFIGGGRRQRPGSPFGKVVRSR
jgi:hypothetical protein